jgi:hypothetical protein
MLASLPWCDLERRWGPHTLDLMSLDSNAQKDSDGKALRHFFPWPTANSAGVNLFAQTLQVDDNAYVFPPIPMLGPVLRFLLSSPCRLTIVIPDIFPRRFWWPMVRGHAVDSVRLGLKTQTDSLLFPTRAGALNSALWTGICGHFDYKLFGGYL